MVYVIATIRVVPGQRPALLSEFRKLVPEVLREHGCIEYGPAIDITTDIATQETPQADVITVLEKWHDQDALKSHLAAPHMVAYRERVKDLVESVSLRVLCPA